MVADEVKSIYDRGKWGLVLRGVLGIVLGIFIFVRPITSVAALALVIAIWALIDGIVNIVHAFDLRHVFSHWWVRLLAGIVGVLFGLAALVYYPTLSLAFVVVWTALWLITAGAVALYAAAQDRRAGISWGWPMAFGLIAVVVGVLALVYPGITLAALIGLIAGFGIGGGIALLLAAAQMGSLERDIARTGL